jgi:glucoamylase
LLTGERGHYAVAANQDGHPWLEAMARMTGPGGLIPEQIWDSEAIPQYHLFPGKPSGSAMPLIWAHAEYLKLLAAQTDGSSSDALPVVEQRYPHGAKPEAANWHWCDDMPFDHMPSGRGLSIERPQAFEVTFTLGHSGEQKRSSETTAFGLHVVRFSPDDLKGAGTLALTISDRADRPINITIG